MNPNAEKAARNQLGEAVTDTYQLAEKLSTMASGILAFTVTFARDASIHSGYAWMAIRIAWAGFICTVLGYLLLYLVKIRIHEDLFKEIKLTGLPDASVDAPAGYYIGKYMLIFGFFVGMISLAAFGFLVG